MELSKTLVKRLVAGGIFVLVGLYLASVVPSVEIAWVSAVLLLTTVHPGELQADSLLEMYRSDSLADLDAPVNHGAALPAAEKILAA